MTKEEVIELVLKIFNEKLFPIFAKQMETCAEILNLLEREKKNDK